MKAGCFACIVLQMYCYHKWPVPLLTVSCVGVQCVIVVFPNHTHLLFERMDIEIILLSNFATMYRIWSRPCMAYILSSLATQVAKA